MLDVSTFKNALANFPSGVVIATTRDRDGGHRGFTASAFSSVSLSPPLVLVCLARSAECFDAFSVAEWFGISVLTSGQEDLALRFATRGVEKFSLAHHFEDAAHGLKTVSGALATMICRTYANYPSGDHAILVGEVDTVTYSDDGEAMLHYRRGFRRLDGHRPAAMNGGFPGSAPGRQ